MPVGKTLAQVISGARSKHLGLEILTSGEWHQIRKYLQRTNPEAEDGMITGSYERTSTVLDYVHGSKSQTGKWFNGLLIQHPEIGSDRDLAKDEKGILSARDVWEMALPLDFDFVKNMPREFDPFLDTIYGMEGARKKLSDSAFVKISPEDKGLINLLRGNWNCGWPDREGRRVSVLGVWDPFDSDEDVASRAAISEDFIIRA